MPVGKDKRKILYDAVSEEYDLGTYEEFNQKLDNPEKRKVLYEAVGSKYNLGTYDEFNTKVGTQKKSPSGTSSDDLQAARDNLFAQDKKSADYLPKEQRQSKIPTNYIDPKSKVDNGFFSSQSTGVEKGPDPNKKVELETERIVSEQADQERADELAKLDNGISKPMSYMATFNQHVYGLPADLLQTFAIGANQMGRLTEAVGLEDRVPVEEQPSYKLAEWYRNSIKELSPDNPALQDEWETMASGALGDLTTLVLTGGIGGPATALNEIQQFSKSSNIIKVAANEGKKIITSPPALVGAIQMGANEFNQAKASGATDDEAFDAFIKNAGVGSILEAIPIMKYFKRLDSTSGGGVKKLLAKGTAQGVDEMTTEVVQQVYSNVNASQTYDKTREWFDGIVDSGGIGFGLGFFLGAMGTSLRKKKAEAKTPEEQAEVQRAIDFVDQKSEELTKKQEAIDGESNQGAEAGAKQETVTPQQQEPVSEGVSTPVDQSITDVTNEESEVIPEEQKPLSDNTLNAIQEEVDLVSNSESNLEKEFKKQDLIQSLDNPEISGQDKAIIEEQIKNIDNPANEKITQTQEGGQANSETPAVQEGQKLEEEPVNEIPVTQEQASIDPQDQEVPQVNAEQEVIPPVSQEQEIPEAKKRKFTQQVLNDPDISDEFKEGITEDTENYIPTSNNLNNKEADLFIEANGPDAALEKLTDTNNLMKPKARVSVANKLIKNFNKQAKEATSEGEKTKALEKAIKTTDFIAKQLTEMGQGVQAASMYAKLSPEGVLRYIQNEITKTRQAKLDKVSPKLKANKAIIDKINKETVEKVLSTPKIKNIIEGKVKTASENRKKAVKKATDFLEGLKINTKGVAGDATFIIPATAWNGAISTIQKSLELGLTVVEAIDAAVKYVKANHKEEWDEKGFRKEMSSKLSKYEATLDPEGATKKGLKDLDITIGEIIKQHYSKVDSAKKTLVQKILDNTDLTDVDAKEIARNIEAEFDKLTTVAKKKALMNKLSVKSILLSGKKERQLYNDMIELSNLGALSEKEWNEFYAKKFELPQLTPEQASKLTSLADKVQNAKEGEQKVKATQDLLAYQEKIKGINWADVGSSIWYANILSGISTQTTNAFSGFMEVLGETAVSVAKNPKQAGFILSNLFQGWGRGGLVGLDVLRTGYQPDKGTKIEVPANLENIKFKGGKWNPYNYAKYVSRLMTAVDIFHYHGLKQMRSAELAAAMAAKEGKRPSKEIKQRAIEILNKSKERIAEAKQQATDEGLTGKEYKRRVYEIVEQSRPEQINEDADDFAAHGTFNYEPEGFVGVVANGVSGLSGKIREKWGISPIQFIIPFTRVVANVMNRSLDWTPHGFVRAAKGGMSFSPKYTAEQRQREIIKATAGTIAMAALWALTDDEEGIFEITADGTGDQRKNYELQGTGWRPYSIRIGDKWYNYQNTPLSIPFAMIGFARDAMKYKGEKDIDAKFSIAAFGGAKYMMDMSFLGSLSGFFGAFGKNNPNGGDDFMNKMSKEAGRTAKGFIIPNAFTQVSKSLQEIYELPTKRASGIMDEFVRDMPVLRDDLDNMYNTLGEPIVPDQNRKFLPFKVKGVEDNKVWDLITENQAFIGSPSKQTIIYDPKTDTEREMTDKEYNKFALESGKLIKKTILEEYDELKKMSKGEVKDRISEIKEDSRKEVKENLLNK
jgi:hypothetical protein